MKIDTPIVHLRNLGIYKQRVKRQLNKTDNVKIVISLA